MDFTNKTIGQIVADDFRAAAVFKKYGIDFCCKGGRTIEDACGRKKVSQDAILSELDALPKGGQAEINASSWPLDLLINYIVRMHHRYVQEKTPYLLQFLDKLCRVHGERHPELFEINEHFMACAKELSKHLEKEEQVLFPYVTELVEAAPVGVLPASHFDSVETPIAMMMHEHSVEVERFEKIAQLTGGYIPPADACNTYRVAFAMLEEFENDLHKHIHLENNILFPKVIALEKKLRDRKSVV